MTVEAGTSVHRFKVGISLAGTGSAHVLTGPGWHALQGGGGFGVGTAACGLSVWLATWSCAAISAIWARRRSTANMTIKSLVELWMR